MGCSTAFVLYRNYFSAFYIFLYFLHFYIIYIFYIFYISIFFIFLHFLHFGNDMADVCGIIADIKREGEGEYIIPTCTIFGLDKEEEGQLESHGLKVSDSNPRMDGV